MSVSSDLLWSLFDKVILWLASLNPATKAKIEVEQAKAAALENERKLLLADIEISEQRNKELKADHEANGAERERLESEIQQSKADLAVRIADRAKLSDDDKVRLDL